MAGNINERVLALLREHWPKEQWPKDEALKEAERKVASGIMEEFQGRKFTVHDAVPSELLWAKRVLGIR